MFTTSDLSLATTLMTDGFNLAELNRDDPRRVGFVFEDSNDLKEAIKQYWNNELLVEPQAYFNNMKQLKNRMYNN